jgi:Mg2+/Co2+ transporter CorB|tara:strand:+ start:922 stop:2169 length:1248 start_codon:yes stop_codon:yes gene_type:complete
MINFDLESLFFVLFILLLLSAFFSGAETSLMSVNRYKLKHKHKLGDSSANKVNFLVTNPEKTLGLILLLNNFVNILASAISTLIAIKIYGEAGVAISVVVLTIIILIFAEVTPKTFAALYADKIAYPVSLLLYPLMKIFYPIVILINFISKIILRMFGIKTEKINQELLTKDEIKLIVKESSHRIPKNHEDMIVNMIDLEKVKVEDAMIPRNELVAVDIEDDLRKISKKILNCKHTRIPIYKKELNKLLGFLHKRKVIDILVENKMTKENILEQISPPYFIPEDTSLTSQLINFKKQKKRIGFVVDEYGDVKGVVTLDDILEEIVGDFDENAKNDGIIKINSQTYIIDGTIQIREINKSLDWEIPETAAKTINGYILECLENIPTQGETFDSEGYLFEIVEISNNFVKNVKVTKK